MNPNRESPLGRTARSANGDPMTYELHVLEGEQQGASTTLPEGAAVTVSGAFDSDVVLRGDGLAERRISLTAQGNSLRLQVLRGEAEVEGRSVGAGQTLTLALDTVVALGATRIGVVRVAGAAAAAPSPTPAPDPAPLDAAASRPSARTWSRRLVTGGGVLASVSIGVLAFAYAAGPQAPTPQQRASRAEAVLHGAGLQRLSVRAAGNGEVRVDGYLETTAQRAQAERLLADERIEARWQVWVNEQVASAVQDVYRVNGVSASVQSVGPGAVRVATEVADPLALDGIRDIARRDVPGLAAIEVENSPRPQRPAPAPVIDDPGKRVSAIVPGDPAYVVTVDGTRYFQGALLPTGHRIAGIEERQVVLELNGVRTPLVF